MQCRAGVATPVLPPLRSGSTCDRCLLRCRYGGASQDQAGVPGLPLRWCREKPGDEPPPSIPLPWMGLQAVPSPCEDRSQCGS